MTHSQPKIGTSAQRTRLEPRREPYWVRIQSRGYLGFRRLEEGGRWIARYRVESGQQKYQALKLPPSVPNDEARDHAAKVAQTWFAALSRGVEAGNTVQEAADHYIANLRAEKGDAAADDAQGRVKRCIKESKLWVKRLDRLTTTDIKNWRNALVPEGLDEEATRKARDSANRNLTTLKALLNLAWADNKVDSPNAWAKVKAFEQVAEPRRVFLDIEQRRRLLEYCDGAFKSLIEAGMQTGARYGELRHLKVEDFDKAARRLEIRQGKTGARTVALSNAAVGFFARLSRDRLPSAYILVRDDGQQWQHSDQDELMRAVVKKAKLPRKTVFYTLRHSFIAAALSAGIDINTVAKSCGTSVRIIEKNYAKYLPEEVSKKFSKVAFV